MQNKITLELFVEHSRQGAYFTLPFSMPPDTEGITIRYQYERYHKGEERLENGSFYPSQEINIIDIGLVAPDGSQVGASGSDKLAFSVSETQATPGYQRCILVPGEWQIMVGAYKVAPDGVKVTYELEFTSKKLRLLRGDLHVHTLASDGVSTVEELAFRAQRNGLDYLAITDHNQMIAASSLPQVPDVTLIQGMEWTHYQGHANFVGVDRPFDTPFAVNSFEEAKGLFETGRKRGALVTINHPFEPGMGFTFDFNSLPFDCLEIWNGPMRISNLQAIGLWQSLLAAGKKLPACGGSDYHRDTPFIFLGGPTTCVYSKSGGMSDILSALKLGHSYITFSPQGPRLELTAGERMLGDTVKFPQVKEINICADNLLSGDVVQVVSGKGSQVLINAPADGRFQGVYKMDGPGFARVEILRAFLPGLPMLPALISNPIYFEV